MTTPQDILYRLNGKMDDLKRTIEGYDREDDSLPGMAELIKDIHQDMSTVKKEVDEIKGILNLLVKLLSH
jgi:hypothetical protein